MQGQISFSGGKMGVARPTAAAADSLRNAGVDAMDGTVTGNAQDGDAAGVGESSADSLDAVRTSGGILEAIRSRAAVKRKAEDDDQEGEVGGGKRQKRAGDDSSNDGKVKHTRQAVFNFMELPSEIRIMVYECVCVDNFGEHHHMRDAVAMIAVSRQIREEALPVMFDGLSLLLNLSLLCSCESCEPDSKSVYPRQMLDLDDGVLHHETLPSSCGNTVENLSGHRINDYTLDMLSYLKRFRVQLSQE